MAQNQEFIPAPGDKHGDNIDYETMTVTVAQWTSKDGTDRSLTLNADTVRDIDAVNDHLSSEKPLTETERNQGYVPESEDPRSAGKWVAKSIANNPASLKAIADEPTMTNIAEIANAHLGMTEYKNRGLDIDQVNKLMVEQVNERYGSKSIDGPER